MPQYLLCYGYAILAMRWLIMVLQIDFLGSSGTLSVAVNTRKHHAMQHPCSPMNCNVQNLLGKHVWETQHSSHHDEQRPSTITRISQHLLLLLFIPTRNRARNLLSRLLVLCTLPVYCTTYASPNSKQQCTVFLHCSCSNTRLARLLRSDPYYYSGFRPAQFARREARRHCTRSGDRSVSCH